MIAVAKVIPLHFLLFQLTGAAILFAIYKVDGICGAFIDYLHESQSCFYRKY